LRRTNAHRIDHIITFTVAVLVVSVVMCTTTLMSVETAGIKRAANLFSGRRRFRGNGGSVGCGAIRRSYSHLSAVD